MRCFLSEFDQKPKTVCEIIGDDPLSIIQQLNNHKIPPYEQFAALIEQATQVMQKRPNVVELNTDFSQQCCYIVGDLHGCFEAVSKVFHKPEFELANNIVIFNGDLTDRGGSGYQVLFFICWLLIRFEKQIYINRGNHESSLYAPMIISIEYNLMQEMKVKFPKIKITQISKLILSFCQSLPLITLINQKTLVVHGGPPRIPLLLSDIQLVHRDVGKLISNDPRNSWVDLLWSYERGRPCVSFLKQNKINNMVVSHSASAFHNCYVFDDNKELVRKCESQQQYGNFIHELFDGKYKHIMVVQEIFSSPTNRGQLYFLKMTGDSIPEWLFLDIGNWKDYLLNLV